MFYSVSTPLSKLLMSEVPPVFMAAFLYAGAGVGVGITYIFTFKKEKPELKLGKGDIKYTLLMVALDVLAPILMMIGINAGLSSNASLLGNFEIVATTLIAFIVFKETLSKRFWVATALITVASAVLSFDFTDGFSFSVGSLFVILATVCWGFENNCTRKISGKSTYQIVIIKGLCSGAVSLAIAFIAGETFPEIKYIALAALLGYVAYGLSIFMYIKAQYRLGAAKTSAYYAVAPFIGSFLAFLFVGEKLGWTYLVALAIMIVGVALVIADTLAADKKGLPCDALPESEDNVENV